MPPSYVPRKTNTMISGEQLLINVRWRDCNFSRDNNLSDTLLRKIFVEIVLLTRRRCRSSKKLKIKLRGVGDVKLLYFAGHNEESTSLEYVEHARKRILMFISLTDLGIFSLTTVSALTNSTTFIYPQDEANITISFSAAADTGDVAFRLSAPADHDWVAFGIGGQMKNSLMFIAYPTKNGTGKNCG